jgi:DDE superfamily endonuclease
VQVIGRGGTALVDGTVCPALDWSAIPDLFSGKAGYAGLNVHIAANLNGDLAAIGPVPVHGARHDAHAFAASGLKDLLEKSRDPDNAAADLGYIGVDGIGTVPFRKPKGGKLEDWQREFNTTLSKIRSAVEHAIAKVKTWRMLSEEGGRYRVHSRGAGNWCQLMAGSGGSQGFPSMTARTASSAAVPWVAAESR